MGAGSQISQGGCLMAAAGVPGHHETYFFKVRKSENWISLLLSK